MNYLLLIIGFVILVKCADIFVDGSSNLSKTLGIPTLIIGLTVVAFGTSAPEAAVSITSIIKGNNDMSIGNIIGSNICNLLLVLGVSAFFNPLKAKKQIIEKDFLFSILSYVVLLIMILGSFVSGNNYSVISKSEGLILLCFLCVYLYSLLLSTNKKDLKVKEKKKFEIKDIFYIIFGIIGIILGGNLVVDSASSIASSFGISDNLIALTVVAIGTSLPELVTSVVAARKNETDIAIGNVIGSNIFNILFILGTSSAISQTIVSFNSFIDIIIMLIVGIIIYLFTLKNNRIGNKKAIIMILIYVSYVAYIIFR